MPIRLLNVPSSNNLRSTRPVGYKFPVGLSVTVASQGGGPTSVDYLVVAGGGNGGADSGGGGGGGGVLAGTATTLTQGTSYTVTVGGAAANSQISGSGLTTITAIYGGAGNGGNGGSGGGGYQYLSSPGGKGVYPGSSFISAERQGYDGASGASGSYGGGGGGAGGAGSGTSGGPGYSSPISGSPVTYSAGGNGAPWGAGPGANAPANTGRGAQGGGAGPTQPGGTGGSGIVIIRYSGPQTAGGGNYSSSGGNSIHTFTGDGTFSSNAAIAAVYNIN